MTTIPKPQEGEYIPYTTAYISLVPDDGRLLDHLQSDLETVIAAVRPLSDEKLSTPCAEGEWTIKEILIHILDTERVFAYRALRIARGDTTPLPGFDQDPYVPISRANERRLDDILDEYAAVRHATIKLLSTFDDAAFARIGTASNHALSVRAAAYIIAGHELHHLNSIRENYL